MECKECGKSLPDDFQFCPYCGTAQTDAATQNAPAVSDPDPLDEKKAEQDRLQAQRLAYVRGDYNPCRDGHLPPQTAAQAAAAGAASSGPPTTGMLVFSIINIVFCGLGISVILGIIALIFAIMAGSEENYEAAVKKLNVSRVLNLIGLGFIILQVILFFIVILSVLIFTAAPYGPTAFMFT